MNYVRRKIQDLTGTGRIASQAATATSNVRKQNLGEGVKQQPSRKDQFQRLRIRTPSPEPVPGTPSVGPTTTNTADTQTNTTAPMTYTGAAHGIVKQADRDRDVMTAQYMRQASESAARGGYSPGGYGYGELMNKALADATTAGMEIRGGAQSALTNAQQNDIDRQYLEQDRLYQQYSNDPVAMEHIMSQVAQGRGVQDAIASMYNPDGSRMSQFDPQSSSQQAYQTALDDYAWRNFNKSPDELSTEELDTFQQQQRNIYGAEYDTIRQADRATNVDVQITEVLDGGRKFSELSTEAKNLVAGDPTLQTRLGYDPNKQDNLATVLTHGTDTYNRRSNADFKSQFPVKVGDKFINNGTPVTVSKVDVKLNNPNERSVIITYTDAATGKTETVTKNYEPYNKVLFW